MDQGTGSPGATPNVAAILLLLAALPLLVFYLWYCVAFNHGEFAIPSLKMVQQFPSPTWTTISIIVVWLAIQVAFQLYIPGKETEGSPLVDGSRLSYKTNGWVTWWLTWALLATCAALNLTSPAALAEEFGPLLVTANLFGFGLSIFLYWYGRHFGTPYERSANNVISDFYLGTALNPRISNFDLKFFFEARPGLIAWIIFDFAFAAKQLQLQGYVSLSMALVCAFQFWYVTDYFANEEAIVSTWDIRHENFGWMLCWGDLVWVPFTYTIQTQFLVSHPISLAWWQVGAIIGLNSAGYFIFRSANNQKHRFRQAPERAIWGKPAVYVKTSSGSLLLISGWWGLARHTNYLGDLLMALAWCLPCGFSSPLPYFYFIYMTVLLLHRERRDHDICARRYGKDWDLYCEKVRYRIIPGLY
jgi:delta14-sterol reductase/lamin-B receptor